MNKLMRKITTLVIGTAMVVGVGVAVSNRAIEARADNIVAATFTCGLDGTAAHTDGTDATSYSETVGDYTLSITGEKMYTGAVDAVGNGCLKLGTGKAVGSIAFTVPSDVVAVKIYIGGYKATAAKVSVNGGAEETISTMSNSGEYTALEIATATSKSVSLTTVSGGYRCMVNTIEFYIDGGSTGKENSSVTITNNKPLALDLDANPVQLTTTTSPSGLSLTYASSNANVASVSNMGIVTPNGTGTAVITAAFAGDDSYNPSADTITVKVTKAEPAHITGKTISQIVSEVTAAGNSTPQAVYEIEGYVTAWKEGNSDGTQYGNFYIADVAGDTANQAYVYGSNYENGPVWDGEKYTFQNNKTFLTNEVTSQIQIGSKITAEFMAWMYNPTTFEFSGEIKSVGGESATLESISLSGTQQIVFGVGDTFSSQGLVVTAHYDNGSSKVIEATSISSPDMSTAGQKTVTVTYVENNVTKTATYTITVNTVVVKYTVTFSAGEGSGTMSPVEVTQGATYQLPECTFTAPEGKVFDGWTINGVDKVTQIENIAAHTTVTALWKDSTPAGIVSDVLTRETTGVSGTAYDSWSDVKATSDAVYAGNSAGGKESIQLRSGTTGGSNIHSGIVSTTSGGKISSVEVVWNETDTTVGRTLWVYGSNTAYATPDELYATATSGTKVGEIVCGTSTSVEFTDEYAYVAVRCKENALYLTSITFNWEAGTPVPPPPASNYTVTYVEGSHTGAAETVAAGTQITLKNFDSQYVPLGKQFVCWSIGGVSYQVGDTYTVNANTTINAVYQDVTPEGEIQYIEVYQVPVKETYKQGQEFDPTGLIIVGVYEGDVRAQIANEVCEFSSIANAPLGKATVIVTYKGRTTSVPVVIVEPTFKSISVNKLPDKVEYERNEELDITGIEIQFNYEDNVPSKVVNPTIVDYIYDFSEPGEKTVVVKYGDSTATFKVTVLVPTMTDLVISHDATKVEYEVHDELDLTGLVVTALYSDQSAEIVSLANCVITGFDSTAPGERTVVIAYGECSVTYDVTIKVPVLVSITIGSPVTKTVYDLHQTFDPSGLSLVANYSHGEHVNINLDDVEFSGFDSESVGVKVITASYGGTSTSFAITVREPVFSHIAVSELPVQLEYECFEEFNPEGMEVVNVFSDGSTTPINLEDVEFEYDFTEPGIKDVIVSYQGNTASFQVEVLEPVLVALYFYTAPDKLYYEVGEQLDLSGCYLLAELSDGELFLIPADYCEPSGFDSVTPGIKTVTLSLMGVSISYQILVKVTTYELVVAKEPTKNVYDLGDSFDPTGMKVEIHYSTGDVISVKLDKLTFSELDSSSTGEKEILISYQDMEAILVVSVREPVLVSVHADGQMGKVAYISGDEWSDEGFSLVATYSDGSTKDVSSDAIWSFSEEAPVTGMTSVIVSGEYTDGEITVSDEFELSIKVKDSLYAEAWAEEFLSLVSEACSGNEDGALNKKVELKSIWDTMSQKYVNQLSDTEKAKIIGAVANADAQDDPIARAMAFYDFACKKYGLSKFVENRVISAIVFETTSSDKVTPIALIVVASLAAVTALGMVVTYKRRKNENIH